ncbi:hypothetical protein KKC06_03625 [Patescibacteria group bacterium]|nr:hypothetical protein [Patescibacteria group bacterium]
MDCDFWKTVLINVIAGAIVFILFSIFLIYLINHYRRPRLKLVCYKEFTREFNWLEVNIRNNGKTSLKEREINWHLYIPKSIDIEFLEKNKYKNEYAGPKKILNEPYNHYRDYNKFNSFPEREITIAKIKLNSIEDKKFKIYYYFSTLLGMQPRRTWGKWWYHKIAEKNGEIRFRYVPFIRIDYSMDVFKEVLLQINRELNKEKIRYLLVGSYALYLQGLVYNEKMPKDIDIIVSSQAELQKIENAWKEYIIEDRKQIPSTGGEQTRFRIKGVEVEVFWETKKTYSNFLEKPKWKKVDGQNIPLISPKDELEAKKAVVALRGYYNEDREKIEWLENLLSNKK